MENKNANIFICTETEEQSKHVIKYLEQPYSIRINDVPSFSKMINDCIRDCSNDILQMYKFAKNANLNRTLR